MRTASFLWFSPENNVDTICKIAENADDTFLSGCNLVRSCKDEVQDAYSRQKDSVNQ